jgi:iron complex outermembrane recepter protein
MKKLLLICTTLLLVGNVASNIVFANSALADGDTVKNLEVITVTAQKRTESIQDVPIAISAISTQKLEKLVISNAADVVSLAPNVNSTRSIGGGYNYFIRGVGMDDFNLSSVPAIGLLVDDVSLHSPVLANFALFDLSQVEVLRGPQNTLYGKNTTGGVIKFNTVQPYLEDSYSESNSGPTSTQYSRRLSGYDGRTAYSSLTLGSRSLVKVEAALPLLFSETIAGRISGFAHSQDGLLKNDNSNSNLNNNVAGLNDDYQNINKTAIRIQLAGKVSDRIIVQGALNVGKQSQISEIKPLIMASEGEQRIDIQEQDLSRISTDLIAPPNDVNMTRGDIKIAWQLPDFTVQSITSFEDVESKRKDDWGSQSLPSSVYQIITFNTTDTSVFSQEFQLQSNQNDITNWLVGAMYSREQGDLLQTAYIDPVGPGRPDDAIDDAGQGPLFDRGGWVEKDTRAYSFYGQYDRQIANDWQLSGGLRWTTQRLSPTVNAAGMMMDLPGQAFPLGSLGWYSLGNPNFNIFTDYAGFEVINAFKVANGGFPATVEIDESFEQWGGKLSLAHDLSQHVMTYASIVRGFKMGSVNSNPTSMAFTNLLNVVVKPETLVTYEIGAKAMFADENLRINSALFYNDWDNYQFYQVYNPGNPAQLFASLINLPEARSYGAETELEWHFKDNWRLDIGLGWLETEVVDGTLDVSGLPEASKEGFQNSVVAGNELTNAPEWSSHISLERYFDLQYGELDVLLHFEFKDEHIHQLAGKNSEAWQYNMSEPSVGLWSLNVNYTFGHNRQYSIGAWAKNITDEQYCLERAIIPGTPVETTRLCARAEPRSVGITFKASLSK